MSGMASEKHKRTKEPSFTVLNAYASHSCCVVVLGLLDDHAVRGLEGDRSISTPCRGTLLKGTRAGWIYPRSSHPTSHRYFSSFAA